MPIIDNIHLHNADNLDIMKTLPDESIDVICIDPPYLYLKNQKLERVFDELKFFSECKRLLTKDGFIVMFGRGTSFYRWNTILEDLKFTFKEEIIWNKRQGSSPVIPLSRIHETISVFCKGNSRINNVKIPVEKAYEFEPEKMKEIVYRLSTTFGNRETFKMLTKYYESKLTQFTEGAGISKHGVSISKQSLKAKLNRTIQFAVKLENGAKERSIISETRDHYSAIHPTQKPVRLLERLLKLVIPMKNKKIVVADWFSGSNSCCEAVINLQSEFPDIEFEFIGTEIDKEYFDAGKERIDNLIKIKEGQLF